MIVTEPVMAKSTEKLRNDTLAKELLSSAPAHSGLGECRCSNSRIVPVSSNRTIALEISATAGKDLGKAYKS